MRAKMHTQIAQNPSRKFENAPRLPSQAVSVSELAKCVTFTLQVSLRSANERWTTLITNLWQCNRKEDMVSSNRRICGSEGFAVQKPVKLSPL